MTYDPKVNLKGLGVSSSARTPATQFRQFVPQNPVTITTLMQGPPTLPNSSVGQQIRRNFSQIGTGVRSRFATPNETVTNSIPTVRTAVARAVNRINTVTSRYERK